MSCLQPTHRRVALTAAMVIDPLERPILRSPRRTSRTSTGGAARTPGHRMLGIDDLGVPRRELTQPSQLRGVALRGNDRLRTTDLSLDRVGVYAG